MKSKEEGNKLITVLMKKNNISEQEAREKMDDIYIRFHDVIHNGTFCDMEDFLDKELGLSGVYAIDVLQWRRNR